MPLPNIGKDRIGNSIRIFQHIGCRDMEERKAALFEPGVAQSIPFGPITHIMTCAIYLYGQLCGGRVEIEDVGANRMLAAEFYALRLAFEQAP